MSFQQNHNAPVVFNYLKCGTSNLVILYILIAQVLKNYIFLAKYAIVFINFINSNMYTNRSCIRSRPLKLCFYFEQ